MYKLVTAVLIFISFSVKAQQPEMKGGLANFIKSNTIYPAYSLQNCITGTVNVGFKLNSKGHIYYSTVVKGIGTDLDEEALRLIRLTNGKWTVSSKADSLALIVVPVNFSVNSRDCSYKIKAEIAMAIKAYQDEEELKKVVLNFYRNKEKGLAKPEDELKILRIKDDLNIDDEYLNAKIEMGLKKFKQGDLLGACEDFNFVKYMGSDKANSMLAKYCK